MTDEDLVDPLNIDPLKTECKLFSLFLHIPFYLSLLHPPLDVVTNFSIVHPPDFDRYLIELYLYGKPPVYKQVASKPASETEN